MLASLHVDGMRDRVQVSGVPALRTPTEVIQFKGPGVLHEQGVCEAMSAVGLPSAYADHAVPVGL